MSIAGDTPEVAPAAEPVQAGPAAPISVTQFGMPAPAFSVKAHKEHYRFFFAGLIMFLGCLMPFGPEWAMAGYKTLGGAVFTIISLGIMWISWVSIAHNKFDMSNMKWWVLGFLPFAVQVYHLCYAFQEPAVMAYMNAGGEVQSWGELWAHLIDVRNFDKGFQLDNFIRAYGTGKLVLLFGSTILVFNFFKALMGGAKAGKQKTAARAAAKGSAAKGVGAKGGSQRPARGRR